MQTHDTDGRAYANFSTLVEGDKVQVDGGFPCMEEGDIKEVFIDRLGKYILCNGPEDDRSKNGCHHYLSANLSSNGNSLVGIYKCEG